MVDVLGIDDVDVWGEFGLFEWEWFLNGFCMV